MSNPTRQWFSPIILGASLPVVTALAMIGFYLIDRSLVLPEYIGEPLKIIWVLLSISGLFWILSALCARLETLGKSRVADHLRQAFILYLVAAFCVWSVYSTQLPNRAEFSLPPNILEMAVGVTAIIGILANGLYLVVRRFRQTSA